MSVIKFIREDQLPVEFKKIPETSKGVVIAAPFWGLGATETLGLSRRKKIKILCTFDALTCNPNELAALRFAGAEIRSNSRLHAKIYCIGNSVIVGSSNPSRYGLTQEGDTLSGSIEGNILTDDEASVESARRTIEDLWLHPETVKITDQMIHSEINRRVLLPKQFVRRSLKSKTLLAACREAPELFESVYIVAYDEGLGAGASRELRRLQAQSQPDPSFKNIQQVNFKNSWGYQLEATPPSGAWLVDLDCKRDTPIVRGSSQVPSPLLAVGIPDECDLFPTIRGDVSVPGAAGVFKIAKKEKLEIVGIAKKLTRMAELVPLHKAVALIDKRGKA